MSKNHLVLVFFFGIGFLIILSIVLIFFRRRAEKRGLIYMFSLFRLSRFQDCKEYTQKYLKAFPDSTKAWIMLGNVGLELIDFKLSQKAYKKALQLDPNSDRALVGLGVVSRNYQDFNEAENLYYKALRINPESHQAKSSLMLLEIYKGNFDVAIALGEDSIKRGIEKVEPAIIGNLVIAYHYSNNTKKRDELFEYLKNNEFANLFYLIQILDNKINFERILETKL